MKISTKRWLAAMGGGLLLGTVLSWVSHSPGTRLDTVSTGDDALRSRVETLVEDERRGLDVLSIAEIQGDETTFATLGSSEPAENRVFELGSITKLFTGMLLADAIDRGEVELDDTVADHLPELDGTDAGSATLEQLTTHTSGLASIPSSGALKVAIAGLGNDDPYSWADRSEIIDAAKTEELVTVGEREYSNLGVALLGHAIAEAGGAPSWEELVTERILVPLGMEHTRFVPHSEENIGVEPRLGSGWPAPTWSGSGFAPAGASTRTTTEDMALFAAAVLEGTAPGMAALEPLIESDSGERSGMNWILGFGDHDEVAWHNGGTGGSSTMIAVDRDAERAAVVLSNTGRPVEWVAVGLVTDSTPEASTGGFRSLVALLIAAIGVGSVLWRGLRGASRVSLITGAVDAVTFLAIAFMHGPWDVVPTWIWGAMAGIGVVGAAASLTRVGDAPQPDKPLAHAGAIAASVIAFGVAVYLA